MIQKVPALKAGKSSPQVKVGPAEDKIPCFNRFSPLNRLHTVNETHSNAGTSLLENYISPEVISPGVSHGRRKMKNTLRNQNQGSPLETTSTFPKSASYQDQNPFTNTSQDNQLTGGRSNTKYDLPLRIKNKVSKYSSVPPHYWLGTDKISLNSGLFLWAV